MSSARQAADELAKIWPEREKCGHGDARRCFELLKRAEVEDMRHRALVLAAARVVREYLNKPSSCDQPNCRWREVEPQWLQLITIVDAEVKAMSCVVPK